MAAWKHHSVLERPAAGERQAEAATLLTRGRSQIRGDLRIQMHENLRPESDKLRISQGFEREVREIGTPTTGGSSQTMVQAEAAFHLVAGDFVHEIFLDDGRYVGVDALDVARRSTGALP